jgi:hypothetical protein
MIFFHILFGLPQVSIQQRLMTPENLGHPELLIVRPSVSLSPAADGSPQRRHPADHPGQSPTRYTDRHPCGSRQVGSVRAIIPQLFAAGDFWAGREILEIVQGKHHGRAPPSVFEKKFGHSFQATPTSVSNATLTSPVDSVIAYLNSYVDPAACPLTRLVNPLPMAHVP